jgi:hypothetical protein
MDVIIGRRLSYAIVMTTPARTANFGDLLSARARIGWGGSVATVRPVAKPLYDSAEASRPGVVPYDGMVEATRKMMDAEGVEALTYGDPSGYRGLREPIATSTSSTRISR